MRFIYCTIEQERKQQQQQREHVVATQGHTMFNKQKSEWKWTSVVFALQYEQEHAHCIVHTHFDMCTRRYNQSDNNSESGNSQYQFAVTPSSHSHTHSHSIPNWRHLKCLWYYNQEHIFQRIAHCYCILHTLFFDKNNRLVDFSAYFILFCFSYMCVSVCVCG